MQKFTVDDKDKNQNSNYLYFRASASYSTSYVPVRPFIKILISSAGLVGSWNVSSVAQQPTRPAKEV